MRPSTSVWHIKVLLVFLGMFLVLLVKYNIFSQNKDLSMRPQDSFSFLAKCHTADALQNSYNATILTKQRVPSWYYPHPWTRHYWNQIVEIDDPVIPTSRISRCLQISTNCIILSDYLGLSPELWYLHHLSLDFWDCLESNKTFMTLLGLDDMPTNSYYWYN